MGPVDMISRHIVEPRRGGSTTFLLPEPAHKRSGSIASTQFNYLSLLIWSQSKFPLKFLKVLSDHFSFHFAHFFYQVATSHMNNFTKVATSQMCIFTKVATSQMCIFTKVTTSQMCILTKVATSQMCIFTKVATSQMYTFIKVATSQMYTFTKVATVQFPF